MAACHEWSVTPQLCYHDSLLYCSRRFRVRWLDSRFAAYDTVAVRSTARHLIQRAGIVLPLHFSQHLRQLTDGHTLLPVEITLADGQPVGYLSHFAPLNEAHIENVIQQPFRSAQVRRAFRLKLQNRRIQYMPQSLRRILAALIQGLVDQSQVHQWTARELGPPQ